jgi:hypothetical protein
VAALEQGAQVERVRLAEVEIGVARSLVVDLHGQTLPLSDLERAQQEVVVQRLRGEPHPTVAPRTLLHGANAAAAAVP